MSSEIQQIQKGCLSLSDVQEKIITIRSEKTEVVKNFDRFDKLKHF